MRVIFESRFGEKRLIGNGDTYDACRKIIKKFLDDRGFKSYYTRISFNEEENALWIDVGSHSEFFYIMDLTDEVKNKTWIK